MTKPTCSFPECGRPMRALGYCMTHYQQQRRGEELRPIWKTPRGDACSFPACERPVHARTLCAAHFQQRKKGQELRPVAEPSVCIADECSTPTRFAELCRVHGERMRLYGRLDKLPEPSVAERFWEKVHKTETCWLWIGAISSTGYGTISIDGRRQGAHRLSLALAGVEIPDGYDVDHLCRTPPCVNPNHLEPVTHAENMARAPFSGPDWQRAKTHCPQGHEYTPENTGFRKSHTARICLACKRERSREYRARKRSLHS